MWSPKAQSSKIGIPFRLDLQEQLDESLRHNEVMARSEGKLKDNITELQTRTLNAEAEILLLTGLKNQEENQVSTIWYKGVCGNLTYMI